MHEKDLRLVVVRGFGQTKMLILTSIPGDGSKEVVWRVVQAASRENAPRATREGREDFGQLALAGCD